MFESLIKGFTNEMSDKIMERVLKDPYEENLYVLITAAQKMTVEAIIEACIRGESGKPLARSYGSSNVQSPWKKIFLNPTQLFSLPTKDDTSIETTITIGKNSKRPIKLSMPIMITGMSYGASLSLDAKIAIAKATAKVGIATNTGESGLCMEEREAAGVLIGQYNRYNLLSSPQDLSQVDGIEIQLGQGAWGGAVPKTMEPEEIGEHLRSVWKLEENTPKQRGSRFGGVDTPEDIKNLVKNLKTQYDVPVGIKIAATHFIEKELDIIIGTEADFITLDGAEGGTAGSPTILQDDMGLPTLYALARAARYLEQKGVKEKYDLIIAGGLKTPGEFIKALALGAKAVYIGSIALVAMLQAQSIKATSTEPTPQLVLYKGKLKDKFDIQDGVRTLTNFLISCIEEMKLALIAMGKNSFNELSITDLVCVDKELSEALGIDYAALNNISIKK